MITKWVISVRNVKKGHHGDHGCKKKCKYKKRCKYKKQCKYDKYHKNDPHYEKHLKSIIKNSKVLEAKATVYSLKTSEKKGHVTFKRENNENYVIVSLSGLTPGHHGFHVHRFGNCSKKDGSSAGGHFDPFFTRNHGHSNIKTAHLGDLGNILVNSKGLSKVVKKVDFPPSFVVGRSVIVHEKEDNLKDVSSAGSRQACGIIGVMEKK